MQKIKIEVGANHGNDTEILAKDGSIVYAFEPTHELLNILWGKFKDNGNVKILPFAVDIENNFAEFKIAGQSDWGCSSLHDFSGDWERFDFHVADKYQVPKITLFDFCNLYNITKIDYLWIDAQGNDFNCLLSLKDKINLVSEGQCEVALTKELYANTNNNINLVKPWLEMHGFSVEIHPDPIGAEANLKFYRRKNTVDGFKSIWTLDKFGNQVLRNLYEENKNFSLEAYNNKQFDSFNFLWYEMFNHFIWEDNGCDYERYGTQLNENDVVLDIGANIGLFAYRAEYRNVKQVYCFEPMSPTYKCLEKNRGERTKTFNMAVGSKSGNITIKIPEDFTHCGGGTTIDDPSLNVRGVALEEVVPMIGINEVFEMIQGITYLKIDTEGAEVDILNGISDENLSKLRCLVGEFHPTWAPNFTEFQPKFYNRMIALGFEHFTLYHGDGSLWTVHFWKN